jgi:chaperone modulatory protein CbpM
MKQVQAECIGLDGSETVTLSELSRCCGMSLGELDELVDYCALVPLTSAALGHVFSAHWVAPLRAASKLRLDFDLDLFTVAIVLGNLNRIDILERHVLSLLALLPSHVQVPQREG